jgi:type II secretory pathway component PulK
MRMNCHESGSVLLVVVVLVALLAATVMGHLQVNAEEIQLMRNHLYGAQAMALAEAGLNDALSQLRADSSWRDGFADKSLGDGSYTVSVDGSTITSTATTSHGFVVRLAADVTTAVDGPPYVVRIDELRVNP